MPGREDGAAVWTVAELTTPGEVTALAWSPDGSSLAVGTETGRVWAVDLESGSWDSVYRHRRAGTVGRATACSSLAWHPTGGLVAGHMDGELRIGRPDVPRSMIHIGSTNGTISAVAWSPDGTTLAFTGSRGGGFIEGRRMTRAPAMDATSLAWRSDGQVVASGSRWQGVVLVPAPAHSARPTELLRRSFQRGDVEHDPPPVRSVAWMPDRDTVVAATPDGLDVYVDGRLRVLMEEPNAHAVSLSPDGAVCAILTLNALRLRTTDEWDEVGSYPVHGGSGVMAAHPVRPRIAVADGATTIAIIEYDLATLTAPPPWEVRYVAAKIVLVGDAGAGKTTLGHLLANGEYRTHPTTHGQQFWPLPAADAVRSDGATCEAVLWDLAGQPDYRIVHSLFVDDADLALVVCDPTCVPDPLEGPRYWARALSPADGDPVASLLVVSKADAPAPALDENGLAAFLEEHRIAAGPLVTSSATEAGIPELVAAIRASISWDDLPATITSVTFRRIKEEVLRAKASISDEDTLVSLSRLRALIGDEDDQTTDDELLEAVRNLGRHGFVQPLSTPDGEDRVLMRPELLNNLASSIVLAARAAPSELGTVDEEELMRGEVAFPELRGLSEADARLLVATAISRFLARATCLRERIGRRELLVFPDLIRLRKPDVVDDGGLVEDVAYTVTGQVSTVYAALVVLLGYANVFRRTDQWQDEARYEIQDGHVVGFKKIRERPGQLELVLVVGEGVTDAERSLFQGLFETILEGRGLAVTRHAPLICPRCAVVQERADLLAKTRRGRPGLFCEACGAAIPIAPSPDTSAEGDADAVALAAWTARRRAVFEASLTRVKGRVLMRDGDGPRPTCFVSYAWGDLDHERRVRDLVADLDKGGVDVVFDRNDTTEGSMDVARFVEQAAVCDWIVVVGTPAYLSAHLSKDAHVLAAEMDIANQRLVGDDASKRTVLPVLAEGEPESALPAMLRGRTRTDLRDEGSYFAEVFDLLLSIHRLDRHDDDVVAIRATLVEA